MNQTNESIRQTTDSIRQAMESLVQSGAWSREEADRVIRIAEETVTAKVVAV